MCYTIITVVAYIFCSSRLIMTAIPRFLISLVPTYTRFTIPFYKVSKYKTNPSMLIALLLFFCTFYIAVLKPVVVANELYLKL